MRTSLPRGNREISEPVLGADPRIAPGRPEAVAGDARAGEVGPAHSSGEVGEQGGACRGGADGAKGRDRGEGGTAMDRPLRSGGFAKEPEHLRRVGWRRGKSGGGSPPSSRPKRPGACWTAARG